MDEKEKENENKIVEADADTEYISEKDVRSFREFLKKHFKSYKAKEYGTRKFKSISKRGNKNGREEKRNS